MYNYNNNSARVPGAGRQDLPGSQMNMQQPNYQQTYQQGYPPMYNQDQLPPPQQHQPFFQPEQWPRSQAQEQGLTTQENPARKKPIAVNFYHVFTDQPSSARGGKCKLAQSSQGPPGNMSTTNVKLLGDKAFVTLRAATGGRILFQRTNQVPNYIGKDRGLMNQFFIACQPVRDSPEEFFKVLMARGLITSINHRTFNRDIFQSVQDVYISASYGFIKKFTFNLGTVMTKEEKLRVLTVNPTIDVHPEMTPIDTVVKKTAQLAAAYGRFIFKRLREELSRPNARFSSLDVSHEWAYLFPFAVMAEDNFFAYIGFLCLGGMPVSMSMDRVHKEWKRVQAKEHPDEPLIFVVGGTDISDKMDCDMTQIGEGAKDKTFLRAANHLISGIHGYELPIEHLIPNARDQRTSAADKPKYVTKNSNHVKCWIPLGRDMALANDTASHIDETNWKIQVDEMQAVIEEDETDI